MKKRLTLILLLVLALPAASTVSGDEDDIDQLTVVSVEELELIAGPGRTSAYLAPDGEHFAHVNGDEICLYTTGGEQQRCITIESPSLRRLDTESARWSPDSRYLVMHEEFFRSYTEPDLWVLDATTSELTNITDDGVYDVRPGREESWGNVDVLPRWLSENRILFLRYTRPGDVILAPAVYSIAPDGTRRERLGRIRTDQPLGAYTLAVSPDGEQIAYSLWAAGEAEAQNGIWISDRDGGNPRHIFYPDPELRVTPDAVEFSPDGRYLLFRFPGGGLRPALEPEESLAKVISLESGAVILLNPDHAVAFAGWSPSGSGLAYIVFDVREPEASGLYLSATPGDPGRRVLDGEFYSPTSYQRQMISWTENNVILLSQVRGNNAVVVRLGNE